MPIYKSYIILTQTLFVTTIVKWGPGLVWERVKSQVLAQTKQLQIAKSLDLGQCRAKVGTGQYFFEDVLSLFCMAYQFFGKWH